VAQVKIAPRLAVLLVLCALAIVAWRLASKPVLFHSRILATADDRSCGEYNQEGTGIPILNPLRSRSPERAAEVFLRAASKARCLSGWDERLCAFITRHPIPASAWRLVNRWDSGKESVLFYRLESQELAKRKRNGCLIAHVKLQRTDTTWKITGYGVTPGH